MARTPAHLRLRVRPDGSRKAWWRWPGWLAVPLALVAMLVVAAPPAQAQDLSEIEAELDAAWRELEPLIEDYNKVRSELEANREASDELAEEMEPLQLHATLAEDEVADIAVWQYQAGPMSAIGALVTSGSPTTFVDRLTALDQIAREQQQRLDEASDTLAAYEQQKAELDALIEEQADQEADLAERAEAIEADIEELEQLRDEALPVATEQSGEAAPSGSCPAVSSSGSGAVAAEFACAQIGKPYEFGATGPGTYDCSGLTQAAWADAGVSLTHYTGAQWNEGQAVSRSEAIPGDLVFFYGDLSHVGLYVGGGMMVDAPRAGEPVGLRSIDTMPITGFRRPG